MNKYRIENFTKGWFIGDFLPTIFKSKDFEVAVKSFNPGDKEATHMQSISTEITVVIDGRVKLNSNLFTSGDIIVIPPGEFADFESVTASKLVCVKFPSIPNDKIIKLEEKN
jgi:mannose-6-phosphate isomerase-like protein (cupin superfamily)